ncbi:hypothetical protein ACF0H5_023327 [Mactra antiquata]
MSQSIMESSEMSEEQTPLFDSLSFALLIPFAICFILIFLVCCFADQIKDICRMPSPVPASYLAAEHSRPRRHSRRSRHRSRRQSEEVRNLILSEEGRSRNVSESSSNEQMVPSVSQGHFDRQIPSTISNNMATISEMPDNSIQIKNSLPSTSGLNKGNQRSVTLNPAPHSLVRSNSKDGTKVNFLRNLSMNSSPLTMPSLPENCVNSGQGKSANTFVTKNSSGSETPLDGSTSGPRALSDYLTSVLPTRDLTTISCDNEVSKKSNKPSTADDSQT